MNKEFWNSRYSATEYVFGKEPNEFFKQTIVDIKPGKLLIPGAGEGRDAVYAALLGWEVFCIDISETGKIKAEQLAEEFGVKINYIVSDFFNITFENGSFDAIASIYFHLPKNLRVKFIETAHNILKPQGVFFSESFTPAQLNNTSGGPKDVDMLVSSEILAEEMIKFEVKLNTEIETILNEGKGHSGKANIARIIGRKLN